MKNELIKILTKTLADFGVSKGDFSLALNDWNDYDRPGSQEHIEHNIKCVHKVIEIIIGVGIHVWVFQIRK